MNLIFLSPHLYITFRITRGRLLKYGEKVKNLYLKYILSAPTTIFLSFDNFNHAIFGNVLSIYNIDFSINAECTVSSKTIKDADGLQIPTSKTRGNEIVGL